MATERVRFGPFEFDRGSGTLWREGQFLPLGRRGAALLGALFDAEGAVVSKADLIDRAWPDVHVEDNNLAVQIGQLRETLGRRPNGKPWIVTAARTGYRLDRAIPTSQEMLPTIAVLPFVAMDEVGSFADGFVEDLITALSRFRTFAVVSRTSTESFRDSPLDMRHIAEALGVRYLIEGSVRRDGERLRLTAQLIEGASGLHLWSEKLDGTLDGIFDFQDRLVARVVGAFEPQIRRSEIERARRKRPDSLDAYDFYLRALPLLRGVRDYRVEDFSEAIVLLEQAIELDPGFAPALAMCAGAHELRLTNGGVAPEGVDDAREALDLVERALQADSSDAMVLLEAGALSLVLAGDEARAFMLLRQAEALNPNSSLIANTVAYCFWHAGQIEESITRRMHALRLVPGAPEAVWIMSGLAQAHLSAGQMEEALHWGLRALEKTDLFDTVHCVVAAAYAHLGRQTEAEAQIRRAVARWPDLTIHGLIGAKKAPRAQFRSLEQGLLRAGLPAR
jgi:TolB-like protein/Tfp pilus assembly protein PilF